MSASAAWLALLAVLAPGAVRAQPAMQAGEHPMARLSFHFERAGVSMPAYTFVIREDGAGSFDGMMMPPAVSRYSMAASGPAQPLELTFALAPATVARLFARAREADGFARGCESKLKNIAATGQKTLTLEDAAPPVGSCTFNYTEQKPVAELAESFIAMAFTLEEGEKLKLKHRFDRLGLDAEMKTLSDAAKDGHAQELGLIAPVLRSLVDDVQLMDRVHLRAQQLLETAAANP